MDAPSAHIGRLRTHTAASVPASAHQRQTQRVGFSLSRWPRTGKPVVITGQVRTAETKILAAACMVGVGRRWIRTHVSHAEAFATCKFVVPKRSKGKRFRIAMAVPATCPNAAGVPDCDNNFDLVRRVR